jgi:hypothetical protein
MVTEGISRVGSNAEASIAKPMNRSSPPSGSEGRFRGPTGHDTLDAELERRPVRRLLEPDQLLLRSRGGSK